MNEEAEIEMRTLLHQDLKNLNFKELGRVYRFIRREIIADLPKSKESK